MMERMRKSRDDPIIGDGNRAKANPSKRSGARAPDLRRVRQRPDPESWGLDELLTIPEAALLHWPQGPLTVTSLRTAIRDGQLAVAVIAGKFFTTRRHLSSATACKVLEKSDADLAPKGPEDRTLTKAEARQLFDSELSSLGFPRSSQAQ
jgi:hypothetical protein